jgi:hypothetical protein
MCPKHEFSQAEVWVFKALDGSAYRGPRGNGFEQPHVNLCNRDVTTAIASRCIAAPY